jgi:hypothetical protein
MHVKLSALLTVLLIFLYISPVVCSGYQDLGVDDVNRLLKDVFVIDTDRYIVSNVEGSGYNCGFNLINNSVNSELRVYSYLRDEELYMIEISIENGPLLLRNNAIDLFNSVEGLKRYIQGFIRRYKEFFNLTALFYDDIARAVSKIKSLNSRQTVIEDHVLIEVYVSEVGIDIYSSLIINNATTPRLFGIFLPNPDRLPVTNGRWTCIGFYDKFRFTKIAETNTIFTKQAAVDKAISLMKEYFNKHPEELYSRSLDNLIKDVKVKLTYAERGSTLCPIWEVWIYFKETLPNGIYGFSASIWTDTGELRSTNILGTYRKDLSTQSSALLNIVIVILTVISMMIIMYLLIRRK